MSETYVPHQPDEPDEGPTDNVVPLRKPSADPAPTTRPDLPADPGPDPSTTTAPTESGETGPTETGEESGGVGRPVDSPTLPGSGVTSEKRRPILAEWLTDRRDFNATATRALRRAAYATGYHGVRAVSGVYVASLARYAPRGAARVIGGRMRWVSDAEGEPLRQATAMQGNAGVADYLKLSRQRDRRVRFRSAVMTTGFVVGLPLTLAMFVLAPGWLLALSGVVVTCVMGMVGQPEDRPVIGPAVLKTEVPKLTSTIVLRGLGAIGNAAINAAIKKGGDMNGMRFTSDIQRDGPGYRAEIDLPYGVTPEDVMEERQALASGMRRKMGCVWPSGDPTEHEGRMVLWVGDKPMNETDKPAWPLLKSGSVDLFKPVVFGNDQRMRDVSVTLMFASVVVGSIPRMGKTFLMRLLLLVGALDPRAEVHAYDFKGTGDFGALEPVCHRYRAGDEDEDIEYVVHALRELKEELRRRAKVIRSLPRSRCPESKVTPQLANDRKLRLHPIVVGFDECQVPFEHEKYGAEIEDICTDITKRGPALGIIGMFGTQRPDAKSLPTGISSNAVLRFCLKVMGQPANDMVLGTSMYKAGYRATMFSRTDRGICWMAGEGDDPRIVASAFVDAVGAEQIVARARKMREEYGNITGHAIGEEPDSNGGSDILADVLAVVTAEEEQVWCERVAARLEELRPEAYTGWKGENVTSALKPHGVKTGQVWGTTDEGEGKNRRGIKRADLATVVAERDRKRSSD
ncbi:cell division protein FtsK [Streptomyces sp. WMMB303]|uniref:cell division protein FtsK n=1 Tax=Streptomyces sp. WMMB303 TaxID=3034154 RepID=UPI0023EDAFB7|nr:cell division protein FtsK [Streptomyces sp. WMMB303]MDF4250445.1 cell division protein FtsK [Streptomyces sp. WMMB303]